MTEYSPDKKERTFTGSIAARFSAVADRYFDRPAIVSENYQWRYQDLYAHAVRYRDGLARVTAAEGMGAKALLFDHDAPLVAALLGVLMAGRIYLVLDPGEPETRLREILKDSGADVIIADEANRKLAERLCGGRIALMTQFQADGNGGNSSNPKATDICAICYTSGSTGEPKGVYLTHRAVLHRIDRFVIDARITPEDRLTLLTSCRFAASLTTIFGALLNGAALYPFQVRTEGVHRLAEWLENRGITVYHSVPTVFREMTNHLPDGFVFSRLRLVRLGGESSDQADFERFRRTTKKDAGLMLSYSTTETGTICQHMLGHADTADVFNRNLGFPSPGMQIRLVDGEGNPVDRGEQGEIVVHGPCLDEGYWNRPVDTARAFKRSEVIEGGRSYRTGDLAIMLEDGSLRYLGRADRRFKIRGIRIEAGEIESVLLEHPHVREAAVTLKGGPEHEFLVAYLKLSRREKPAPQDLRSYLRRRLPDYMVPERFLFLGDFPRTANGKLDHTALPDPVDEGCAAEPFDAKSLNETEALLFGIWSEVLGLKPSSVHEDFFDLGGHSLSAVALVRRIEAETGNRYPATLVYQCPTIARMAEILQGMAPVSDGILETLITSGSLPPLFFVCSTNHARKLAQDLGDERPVYGLNVLGCLADGFNGSNVDISSIASRFIREIKSVQPDGDYHLCGFCNNGKIAYEMARQLIRQNRRVAMLALIDSLWTPPLKHFDAGYFFRRLRAFGPGIVLKKFFGRLKKYRKLRSNKENSAGDGQGDNAGYGSRELLFLKAYRKALRNYSPHPYPGKVDLFLSLEFHLRPRSSMLYRLAEKGAAVHLIQSYHSELFKNPNVLELAEKLTGVLDGDGGGRLRIGGRKENA
ncbi:MAG: AMP-binding protein [Gammaproteobacteria bacterium]